MKQFVFTTTTDEEESIANCATHVSGFPQYSIICMQRIFLAQARMLVELDVAVRNHCVTENMLFIRKTFRFDCLASPGSFSMSLHAECEFEPSLEVPTFTVYWRHGEREVLRGQTISEAITLAGYGAACLHSIDFYDRGDTASHEWVGGKWVLKEIL
jgi:hypothetical protein